MKDFLVWDSEIQQDRQVRELNVVVNMENGKTIASPESSYNRLSIFWMKISLWIDNIIKYTVNIIVGLSITYFVLKSISLVTVKDFWVFVITIIQNSSHGIYAVFALLYLIVIVFGIVKVSSISKLTKVGSIKDIVKSVLDHI